MTLFLWRALPIFDKCVPYECHMHQQRLGAVILLDALQISSNQITIALRQFGEFSSLSYSIAYFNFATPKNWALKWFCRTAVTTLPIYYVSQFCFLTTGCSWGSFLEQLVRANVSSLAPFGHISWSMNVRRTAWALLALPLHIISRFVGQKICWQWQSQAVARYRMNSEYLFWRLDC